MRHLTWIGRLAVCLGIMMSADAARGYVAIVNKTDHSEIHVVPTPGKVTIDGKLNANGITLRGGGATSEQYPIQAVPR